VQRSKQIASRIAAVLGGVHGSRVFRWNGLRPAHRRENVLYDGYILETDRLSHEDQPARLAAKGPRVAGPVRSAGGAGNTADQVFKVQTPKPCVTFHSRRANNPQWDRIVSIWVTHHGWCVIRRTKLQRDN
jgi:hypothetical protein